MADFYYDDKRLTALFEQLDAKARRKSLRGAMSAAARELRKDAVANLRQSGLKSNRHVEKGIRAVAYRDKLGFRVTVGTKKHKVDYSGLDAAQKKTKAHQEKDAIVPLWAEGGTGKRRTTRSRRFSGFRLKSRGRGRSTGRMPAYRFMEKTRQTSAPKMETTVKGKIVEYVEKTAKKNGATIR